MISSNIDKTTEPELGYGQLLAVLVRRGSWLLGVLAVTLAAAIVFTLREEPTYESSMQLLVEPNYQGEQDPDDQLNRRPNRKSEQDYATQINLMRSSQFTEQAVAQLKPQYPDLTAREAQNSLTLRQVAEDDVDTQIFELTYVSEDPVKSKAFLDTLQGIYQDYNLQQQELRLSKGVSFINSQLQAAREDVTQTQTELEQFRQNQNLIDPQQQAIALTNALNQIEEQQQDIRSEYSGVQARYQALQQQVSLNPGAALMAARLSQSSRYQTLLNELQATELELAQLRSVYTDADPKVQTLLDQRQNQLNLLQQQVSEVLGDIPADLDTSPERLLEQGQLSQVDLEIVNNLAAAEADLVSLEARQQSLAASSQDLRGQLNQFPSLIAQYDRLQPELEIGRTVVEKLLEAQQALRAQLSRGGFSWQVVEFPNLGRKTGPNPKQNLLLGAIVGIFLGAIAAFIREAIDGVVHTSDELKQQTALPLLGIVPSLPSARAGHFPIGLSLFSGQNGANQVQAYSWQPFQNALDLIYKNIQFLNPLSAVKSLTITSALEGEGKTTLAVGLALSAARANQRVLVIDADLRRPCLHRYLSLPNEQGLAESLESSSISPNPVEVTLLGSNFDVLTAGSVSSEPVRLLNSQRMQTLMTTFVAHYDLVILDTPPVLGVVDAVQVASLTSGTILIGRLDRVTQDELNQAAEALSRLNVLGIVANGSKKRSNQYTYLPERNGNTPTLGLLAASSPSRN